jgi:hypothetical protein
MKHLHLLLTLAAVMSATLFTGCGGGDDTAGAVVRGLVSDSTGTPVAGVTITAGTATTTTGGDGHYTLAVTPGANLKVAARKTGLVETFDMVTVAAGQIMPVNFTLRAVGQANVLNGMLAAPRTAQDPRGAQVVLQPNTIIDSTGAAVDSATVNVTTGMPGDANYVENFPGLFVGIQDGVEAPIESFGFVTIDIINNLNGKKCNLRDGATAQIAIPVAPGADPNTPTIPLWSLNETTGKWAHAGVATRDAANLPIVYRATVTHFSTYNLDRAIQAGMTLTVTVQDGTTPVAGATVVVKSTSATGGAWEGRGVTAGAAGTCTFTLQQNGNVQVSAVYGELKGSGSFYDVSNGQATMSITLVRMVSKPLTVYRMVGGVKTPVAGVAVQAMGESQGGHTPPFNGTTNANGQVTLQVASGMMFYMVNANISIEGIVYSGYLNVNDINLLPTELIIAAGAPSTKGR